MNKTNGFTLIELLVAISIISIISVIGLVSFSQIQKNAKDAKIKADLNAIKKAYETNYDPALNGGQGGYRALNKDTNFAGGKIPTQPNGSPYLCNIGPGSTDNSLTCTTNSSAGYQLLATTSDGKTTTVVSDQGTLPQSQLISCGPGGLLSYGLVGYWKFEGNFNDSSNNGNNGTANNGLTATSLSKSGFGTAASFDGIDDYVNGNIPSSTFSSDWTIAAWFNHRSMTSWAGIFSNNTAGNDAAVMTMQGTSNLFGINRVGVSSEGVFVDLGADHYNKWILGVITRQGSTLTVYAYKDGSLIQQSASLSWTLNTTGGFYIGRHWQSGMQIFNGLIDEVRIFDRALPPDQIQALYGVNGSGCLI